MLVFFLQKSRYKNTSRLPNMAPMEIAARFQGLFYISLKYLSKIPLNKEMYPCSQRPQKGAYLHVAQKRGPYGNRRPFPEPYLTYLSGSPVKEPSLQIPLIELPWREVPHSQSPPSFIFQLLPYPSPLLSSQMLVLRNQWILTFTFYRLSHKSIHFRYFKILDTISLN